MPDETARTTSSSKRCSGKGKRRSRSPASASATVWRSASPGRGRACATRAIHSASWALRSSTVEKRRAAKNASTQILNGPLHLALLVAAIRRARPRREVIVPGEVEQRAGGSARDRRAAPARRSSSCRRGSRAARRRALRRRTRARAENSPASDRARSARTSPATTTAPGRSTTAGAAPSRSRILPKWPQSTCACSPGSVARRKIRFALGDGTDGGDVSSELIDGSGVAALADHLSEPRRAQPRVLLQRVLDEALVWVEQHRAHRPGQIGEALGADRALDGLVVDVELGRDRADPPVLGVEESADAGAQLRRDHGPPHPGARDSEAPLVLGAAGAGERLVANVAALDTASGAAEPWRPRGSVRRSMGRDLGAGRSRRHRGADRRRGAHHRGGGHPLATVMRHLLSPLSISTLALGMAAPPFSARLVPSPRREQARPARRRSAGRPAVAVPVIAAPAEEEDLTARRPRAGHEPQGFQAPSARARTDRQPGACDQPCCWITGALPEPAEGSELQLRACTSSTLLPPGYP